jgi:hypothetical protein
MEISKPVQSFLRTGTWLGSPKDNPVVYEKGRAYVKHNAISIGNAGDASGGMVVRFMWNDAPVAWVRFYGAKRTNGAFESTAVPEGRHLIESGTSQEEA